MLKVDAHSHVGKGAAVWSGQDVVNRMDTMKVDKTIIFPFTEGYFNNDEIMDYVNENPDRLIPFCAVNPWNGQEALDLFESSAEGYYQAVLMDLQMPVMDGYTAARRIRNQFPSPVGGDSHHCPDRQCVCRGHGEGPVRRHE